MDGTMMIAEAKDYLDSNGLIVESASLLAEAVISRLQKEQEVEISLAGIHGTSSSYFNTILRTLVEVEGLENVSRRVKFRFDSKAQEHVFGRSWASIQAKNMKVPGQDPE
jgi:hypothetical protein